MTRVVARTREQLEVLSEGRRRRRGGGRAGRDPARGLRASLRRAAAGGGRSCGLPRTPFTRRPRASATARSSSSRATTSTRRARAGARAARRLAARRRRLSGAQGARPHRRPRCRAAGGHGARGHRACRDREHAPPVAQREVVSRHPGPDDAGPRLSRSSPATGTVACSRAWARPGSSTEERR